MRMNPNQKFRSDFIFDVLPTLLSRDLGCGAFETDQHFAWWNKEWQYVSPQKSQEAFNAVARETVINRVGRHRLKVTPPTTVVRDQPSETWEKCSHWGGSRQCANCQRASHVAGAMMKAELLYRENDQFVRWFIKVVLTRRCQEVPDQVVDDMAHAAWHHVVKVIDNFKDPGSGPQRRSWLKTIVEQVVHDYFRDSWRDKRDARLEDSYEAKAAGIVAGGG